jgi:hypothetical protein
VNQVTLVQFLDVQVTFIVIDLEIFFTVIRTLPLLWHVTAPCKSEGN